MFSLPVIGQVNGAIYTTTSTGTTVNGNIYAAKSDVYLSGGPQNKQDPGLVPDGFYYFQVTDPSGAVLLSLDDVKCRVVVVSNGRVSGVPSDNAGGFGDPTCYHSIGTQDDANGALPVQLCSTVANGGCPGALPPGPSLSYYDTPNPGGEYKAWLTPVDRYSPDDTKPQCSSASNIRFGFCDSDSKTDNFKVRNANAAYVTVCKFNDLNGNGSQDSGEPLLPFWPITATGVDTLTGPIGTVSAQTDVNGCVSFSVSDFTTNGGNVTLTEGLLTGWQQTAPPDGTYTVPDGNSNTNGTINVTVLKGSESFAVAAGDSVTAPYFGNTCLVDACGGNTIELTVTKDANPSLTRTFKWGITKSVDKTEIDTAPGGNTTFTYTVSVTHDSGTDSGWQATGTIKVSNPSLVDITGVNVTDAVDNGGSCTVTNGTGITVPAKSEMDVPYTCTYSSSPAKGTNTATAAWDTNASATGTASVDFSNPGVHAVDDVVTVSDPLGGGTLGTVKSTDPSPTTFTYQYTVPGTPGTCVTQNNTATFTTNTTGTTGSASQSVKVCEGANLKVSKTATASYTSNITKSVDKTKVEQSGGTVTFNYTVKVTTSGWNVSGNITVTNPNDWESVAVNLSDLLSDPGGSCTISGGSTQTVPASSFITAAYSCSFAAVPTAGSGTNTATASWNAATAFTSSGSASGSAGYAFSSLTVTDTFNGSTNTLGTVTIPPGYKTFTYSRTVNNAPPVTCVSYTNKAVIKETGQNASQTVTVCNTKSGALTMGFWKNTNGQGIIKSYCLGTSGTSLMAFLTQFNPYKDDTAVTCTAEMTYVANIISGATCSSSSNTCNSMLRAQMLATALDVYFSTPNLGGNRIGPYSGLGNSQPALGGVVIDLSHICAMSDLSGGSTCTGAYTDVRPEFGIAPPCLGTTVSQMLFYSDASSAVNGSPVASPNTGANWYKQIKARQVYAKDGFDDINNQVANIAPSSCSPTF